MVEEEISAYALPPWRFSCALSKTADSQTYTAHQHRTYTADPQTYTPHVHVDVACVPYSWPEETHNDACPHPQKDYSTKTTTLLVSAYPPEAGRSSAIPHRGADAAGPNRIPITGFPSHDALHVRAMRRRHLETFSTTESFLDSDSVVEILPMIFRRN